MVCTSAKIMLSRADGGTGTHNRKTPIISASWVRVALRHDTFTIASSHRHDLSGVGGSRRLTNKYFFITSSSTPIYVIDCSQSLID